MRRVRKSKYYIHIMFLLANNHVRKQNKLIFYTSVWVEPVARGSNTRWYTYAELRTCNSAIQCTLLFVTCTWKLLDIGISRACCCHQFNSIGRLILTEKKNAWKITDAFEPTHKI